MSTRFERVLGRTLWIGVIVSAGLLAAGLLLSIVAPGWVPDVLLQAGIVVLMATPMVRVLLSCAEYVRQRDWFFAFNAFGVLVVLSITIWQAWRS